MQQSDFNKLSILGHDYQIHKNDMMTMEEAEYAVFLAPDDSYDLSKIRDSKLKLIGYTDSQTIGLNDTYTNPYDHKTHLEVIDVDYEQGRILVCVVNNE